MKKRYLTIGCVTIAGIFFILAVIFNKPILGVLAAFFDWLPLPTGWMKSDNGKKSKDYGLWVIIHAIVTIIAYSVFVVWLFGIISFAYLNLLFLLIWWLAVMAGVVLTFKTFN